MVGASVTEQVLSPRVLGLAGKHYMSKNKLQQRPLLLVKHVLALEEIIVGSLEGYSDVDRIAAGFFAFAIYARARHSDAQNAGSILADVHRQEDGSTVGYLEAQVERSKTSTTLERKTRYLPMVAPIHGVGPGCWGLEWMRLLADHGPVLGAGRPLLPGPMENGQWQNIPLSAEAAARWLRSLLNNIPAKFSKSEVKVLGAHSLKVTLLSWASKYGLSVQTRSILGYHSKSKGSVLIYGRDNLSQPLREIEEVIEAVSMKRFSRTLFALVTSRSQVILMSNALKFFLTRPPRILRTKRRRIMKLRKPLLRDWILGNLLRAVFAGTSDLDVRAVRDQKRAELSEVETITGTVKTLKNLAFISSYSPGQADDAYAVVTAELKQQVERTEEVQIRALTQPESAERYENQVKRLAGVNIRGSTEPSERLVDICVAIYERNQLQYVPWSRCSSCEHESQSESRKEVKLTLDGGGKVKVDSSTKELVADTSSEVHITQALQRRALAMEQANIVSYTLLDLWHQRLMKARLTDPPPGYDETRAAIQANAEGRPIDRIIKDVMYRVEVGTLLQPLPSASTHSGGKPGPQPAASPAKGDRGGKAKGKGKGKGSRLGTPRMPAELEA
ncbi:PRSS12 [Symbiodinium sp. CCMP2456]|nr:PRSS12 [Symbiodinium sp. CCMP2456]